MIKRLITLPLVTLLAITGLWLMGAAAASGSTAQRATCSRSISHTASLVQLHIRHTCPRNARAYASFGGDTDVGGWVRRAGKYSTACDTTANCDTHPDGQLDSGGYQTTDGTYHCKFGCAAAHTTALVQRACDASKDLYWFAYAWGFKVKWVCHPSGEAGDVVRSHIVCEYRAGGVTNTYNGGWVEKDGLYSNKACPSAGWVLFKAAWQLKEEDGSVKTVWEWPRSNTTGNLSGAAPARAQ